MDITEINEIATAAIELMNKKITDEIFLIIQKDQELMKRYLRAVKEDGLDCINRAIGKKIKKAYRLSNINDRESKPSSTLIQSHQKFKLKSGGRKTP